MLTRLRVLPKRAIIPVWLAITVFIWFFVGLLPGVAFLAISWIALVKRLEDSPHDSTVKAPDKEARPLARAKDDPNDPWKWIGT
jgi:hypothetical protein